MLFLILKSKVNEESDISYQPMKHKTMTVSKCSVVFAFVDIIIYLADIYTDLALAVYYYHRGRMVYFYVALFVIVISAAMSSIFSFYLYWIDNKNEKLKFSKEIWFIRAVFLLFGISPVLRNIDTLRYALKSYLSAEKTEKSYYARRMFSENNNGSFLRLFEAFLEGGPMLVLQMYIELNKYISTDPGEWSVLYRSVLVSLISVSVSVVAYSRSLGCSSEDKKDFSCFLLPLLFLWRIFEIISRILAISMGISATPYFLAVFILHFIVVTAWICPIKTDFTGDWCAKIFYNSFLGVILSFAFLNPKDSQSKKSYIYFYSGMFAENALLVAVWCYMKYTYQNHILRAKLPAVYVQILSFCLSMLFMVVYYKCFSRREESQEKTQEKNVDVSEIVINNADASQMLQTLQNDEAVQLKEEANEILDATKDHKAIVLDTCQVSSIQSLCAESLSADLGKLLEDHEHTDVVLKCGDETFPAHRSILSARSEVFSAMFRNKMSESESGIVTIADMEPTILSSFLYYLYLGKIEDLTMDVATDLYQVADKYAVYSLKRKCASFIGEHFTEGNVCTILLLADQHQDQELFEAAVNFAINMDGFLSSKQWETFSEEHSNLAVKVYKKLLRK